MRFLSALGALLLVVLAAAGGAVAQGEEPAWADDVHDDLERGAASHNGWVDREDPSFVGDRFVRNERVTLTVSGEDDEAVYSVVTDEEMRITDVGRGPAAGETMRVFASKAALEDVARAQNPAAAFGDAVATGDIRVERLVDVGGHELALGPLEGLLGLVGFGVGAALLGVVGVGTLLSVPGLLASRGFAALRAAVRRVLGALGTLFDILAKLVTAVSAMEILGFGVRERIQATAARVRAGLAAIERKFTRGERDSDSHAHSDEGSLRARLAALGEMRERDERGSETHTPGDEGQ